MDNTINESEKNPVMGRNSALIPDALKYYNATIYQRMDFFKIPFDVDKLGSINNDIWYPAESDKEHMSQSAFDEAIKSYQEKKSGLYFTNTKVNYESCDCYGGGYGCDHADFPTEIEVEDKIKNITHTISIEGDDCLVFSYNGDDMDSDTEIQIYGLKNFSYGDFIRFCKLCNITLESNYII